MTLAIANTVKKRSRKEQEPQPIRMLYVIDS